MEARVISIKPNDKDNLLVTVMCPYCNRSHTHGVAKKTDWTTRAGHCPQGGEYLIVMSIPPIVPTA